MSLLVASLYCLVVLVVAAAFFAIGYLVGRGDRPADAGRAPTRNGDQPPLRRHLL